jgi:hypothetical protein
MKFDHVFEFKITLRGIKPPVWRRIQVPCTYSFWDLHVAIQDAMGWLDYHLHQFEMSVPLSNSKLCVGIPMDEDEPAPGLPDVMPGWHLPIAACFTLASRTAKYEYDFGDGWEHTVALERIFPRPKATKYPRCVAGRRACPPEDCGGPWGYQNLLEALRDPQHEEHTQSLKWLGRAFSSEQFDISLVRFDDPQERWNRAFARR